MKKIVTAYQPTQRDYFIAAALSSLKCEIDPNSNLYPSGLAKTMAFTAIRVADAVIEALNKELS